jgi:hypothetical protein
MDVELPIKPRHDAKHVQEESQPEERHGLAAEVLEIDRCPTIRYIGFR